MSRYWFVVIVVLIMFGFLAAFLSGFFLNSLLGSEAQEFSTLNQAYTILLNHSFTRLPESHILEYGMVRGLLESSEDPYATFQEPVAHELESNNLHGSFGGIGVELSRNMDGDLQIFPIDNGPAAEAGVQNGDILRQIDLLKITENTDIDEVKAAIRGPLGEQVKITIFRPTINSMLEFGVDREIIHLPSVTWHSAPEDASIGIINVHIIAESSKDEIINAVNQLEIAGASKYILDLRDNGGGLLTAAVDTARLFLEEGIIIQQQYRGQEVETFSIMKPGPLSDIPLVILINRNTASAAEIVAGSIQSHGRAILIGENSFGKDSIQLIFDLDDGSSLHITAAKWWLPGSDPPISVRGLEPDIYVMQSETQVDTILNTAITYYKE